MRLSLKSGRGCARGAAYEANDLEQAADHFRAGIELRLAGNPRAGHECLTGLALTNHAQGHLDEVQGVLAIMLMIKVFLCIRL